MTARIAFVVLAIVILALCCLRRAAAAQKAATSRAAATTLSAIPVGKDTTRLLGPLMPNGRVDYVAALNEKYSQGVTPENNAAVKLVEIFGAEALLDASVRDDVLRHLGMTERRQATCFEVFPADDSKVSASFDLAVKGLWREEDHPELVRWLKANGQPLALLVEAANRPRYYMPTVTSGEKRMHALQLPRMNRYMAGGKALLARANLAIGQGKFEDARRDFNAAYLLAGLVGQDATLLGRLVGLSTDRLASQACQNWATSGKLSAGEALQLIQLIQALNTPASMAEPLDEAERYMNLDFILWIAFGPGSQDSDSTPYKRLMNKYSLVPQSSPAASSASKGGAESMAADPDSKVRQMMLGDAVPVSEVIHALRTANEEMDRQVAIAKSPTFRQLVQAAADEQVRGGETDAQRQRLRGMTRQQILQEPGWYRFLLEAGSQPPHFGLHRAQLLAHLTRVHRDMAVVALALAAHRADKSTYSQTLSELVPAYLKEVPKDFCSGEDFIYKPQGDGYLLYSVGENMRDDGGDAKLDIVVKAPAR